MLLTQLFQELYNAADCAMLGYFGEMNALAASGIAGALLSAAGYFAAGPLMVLLQCPAEVVAPASTYLRICACGIMAQLFYNVAAAVLRSLGDSIGPMRCFFVSVLTNLALDALLMIVFHICWMIIFPLSFAITAAAPWLLRIFTDVPGILFNAREAVLFTLPFYVIYAMNQIFLGAIKGFGKTIWPMICTLLCYAVFRVAWCLLLIPVFETMHIVYFSYDVSFFLMFILLLPAYRRLLNGRND